MFYSTVEVLTSVTYLRPAEVVRQKRSLQPFYLLKTIIPSWPLDKHCSCSNTIDVEAAETTDNKNNRLSWQPLHYLGGEYRAKKIPSPFVRMSGKTYESLNKAQQFCCVLSIPSHSTSVSSLSNLIRSRLSTLRQVVFYF